MSSIANGPTEPRVLTYRGQIKFAALFTKVAAFVFLLLGLGAGALMYLLFSRTADSTGSPETMGALTAFAIGGPGIVLWLQYVFILKPMTRCRIRVYADRVQIEGNGPAPVDLHFRAVKALRPVLLGSFGGWFTIEMVDGRRRRISVALERAEYIIEALMAVRPDLLSAGQFSDLRARFVLADHSLARLHDLYRGYRGVLSIALTLALPIGGALAIYRQQSQYLTLHSKADYWVTLIVLLATIMIVSGGCVLAMINAFANRRLLSRLRSNPRSKRRNVPFESKLMAAGILPFVVATIAAYSGVLRFDLNTIEPLAISVGSGALNIRSRERLWIDARYNCIGCRYSLRTSDIVAFKDAANTTLLGIVVALPRQKAFLSKVEQQIYFSEEHEIPEGSLAIQLGTGQPYTRLVPIRDIKGRISRSIPQLNAHAEYLTATPSELPGRPRFSPQMFSTCPPELIGEIRNSIALAVSNASSLVRNGDNLEGFRTYEAAATELSERLLNCEQVRLILLETIAHAHMQRRPASKAGYLRFGFDSLLSAAEGALRRPAAERKSE